MLLGVLSKIKENITMLCKNCKTELPSDAVSCPKCGVANALSSDSSDDTAKKKPKTALIITIIAATLVCIAAALFFILKQTDNANTVTVATADSHTVKTEPDAPLPSNDTPESATEAYVRAISIDRSTDALLSCVHEDIINAYVDATYDGDRDEFLNILAGSFALLDGVDATCNVNPARELTTAEREYISKYYDESTECVAVSVNITFTGTMAGEEINESSVSTFVTVKIDGKWYVDLRLVM